MLYITLLAMISTAAALTAHGDSGGLPPPPMTDPNSQADTDEGHVQRSNAPHPYEGRRLRADSCKATITAIVDASGNDLVQKVKDANEDCVAEIFWVQGNKFSAACNEQDVASVADALYGVAGQYDSWNPKASKVIPLLLYVRGCYFAVGQNGGKAFSDNLRWRVHYGLQALFARNLASTDTGNYVVLKEALQLTKDINDYLQHEAKLAELLYTLSTSWKLETETETKIIEAIFAVIEWSHYNDKDAAKQYYNQRSELVRNLYNFVVWNANFVGTKKEWILEGAVRELARFLRYKDTSVGSEVQGYLKQLLTKYSESYGPAMYYEIAAAIALNDDQDKLCPTFGTCKFREVMIPKILPYVFDCADLIDRPRHLDRLVIRAQSITKDEARELCQKLASQENYFHYLVNSGWKHVEPDFNNKLDLIVFNSKKDYSKYGYPLYFCPSNNGGMYLEGTPDREEYANAKFCAYEEPINGKFNVRNLEHEFTHYLDGRYNEKGEYYTWEKQKDRVVWWAEGFGEYSAYKNHHPNEQKNCQAKKYPLSKLFYNNYDNFHAELDRIYDYGYLAVRFLFERHRTDFVDKILEYKRTAQTTEYDKLLDSVGTRFDSEFNEWCDGIARG